MKLVRIDMSFGSVSHESAKVKQYELLSDGRVWRAFINSYSKKGFVIVEENALEDVLKKLEELNPEVREKRELSVDELIESSYSWNNILK